MKRAHERSSAKRNSGHRVVYGESTPAWERIYPTKHAAQLFAKERKSCGDLIFSIKKVVPGESPQSIMAAIEASRGEA